MRARHDATGRVHRRQTTRWQPMANRDSTGGGSPPPPATPESIGQGIGMLQIPRPCVAASNVLPSGFNRRLLVDVLGRLVPKRDQVVSLPSPASATNAPMSVARASSPRA